MNISISLIKDSAVGLIVIGIIGYSLFLGYGVFFREPAVSSSVSASLLGPRLQAAALIVQEKVSFSPNNLTFTKTPLYTSFIDPPEIVPLSDKRGRDDPFVPFNQ
ncbi:MAG: hypothetical protein RI935_575 [Candidatus Parcubacteria bacterium]|jgi:hypothetical protein